MLTYSDSALWQDNNCVNNWGVYCIAYLIFTLLILSASFIFLHFNRVNETLTLACSSMSYKAYVGVTPPVTCETFPLVPVRCCR